MTSKLSTTISTERLGPGWYLIWVILMLLSGCFNEKAQLENFYFPKAEQVYVFNANDSIGREYWHIAHADDRFDIAIYDGRFNLVQSLIERQYGNGINLEKLELAGMPVQIKSGFVFPFHKLDRTEVLFYHITWHEKNQGSEVQYDIIRNRRFAGMEAREILGDSILCAVIEVDERIISDEIGSIELTIKGKEYYGQRLGLVERERQIDSTLIINQRLLEIISLDAFEQLKD